MRIVKVKKGSTLAMVMIVMSILTITGTAVLSLSLSSYKYRALEQNKKYSLYASESGINEAYEIIAKYVNKGIDQGNLAVDEYNNNLSKMLDNEYKKLNAEGSTYNSSPYINRDGTIIQSPNKIDSDRKEVFKYGYFRDSDGNYLSKDTADRETTAADKLIGYRDYIKNNIYNEDNTKIDYLINDIKNNPYTKVSGDDIKMTILKEDELKSISSKTGEPFSFNVLLQSDYTTNSENSTTNPNALKIKKSIKVTCEVRDAGYNQKNSIPDKLVKIPTAPFSRALLVGGDMTVEDNAVVNVHNSDVYVAGSGNDSGSGININGINIKGKNINSEKSELNIYNGSLVTLKDVNIIGSGDSLNVLSKTDGTTNAFSGNVYARNFFVKPSASGARVNLGDGTTSPYRDGSLYTMDDLEIAGTNSVVDIKGNYNGVSDGSEGVRNDPDQSSAVNINATDIGSQNGSSLSIGKNVCIAGTGYINLTDKVDSNNIHTQVNYQTGESMSVMGNYVAYTAPLSGTDSQLYDEKNTVFEYLNPLTLVTKFNNQFISDDYIEVLIDNISGNITVVMTDKGKDKYTLAKKYSIEYGGLTTVAMLIGTSVPVQSQLKVGGTILVKLLDDSDKEVVNFPNEIIKTDVPLNAFDKSKYFNYYSKQYTEYNGLNLSGINVKGDVKNNINSAAIINSNNIYPSSWSINNDNKIKAKRIQLKNQLLYMGMAEDVENLTTSIDSTQDITGLTDILTVDGKSAPVITLDSIIDFSTLNTSNINSSNEILYLNNDSSSNYPIAGSSGSSATTKYKGIIITAGNIEVSGNVEFTGMLVCKGNLTVKSGSTFTINYDKDYLRSYIVKNSSLFTNIFKTPPYTKDNPNNYINTFIYNNNIVTPGTSVQKILAITKWELIK